MNGFINAKTNIKKLQFGEKKCHRMHIGRKNNYCPDLYIDSWKVETLELEPDIEVEVDELDGDYHIEDSDKEKYLGDLLTSDGTNTKNIKERKAKGYGIVDKINAKLEEVFFGPFSIQVGLIFRCSHFLNSILLNSEVWYGLTRADVDELEVVDHSLLRRILSAPSCTPTPMLYLELGCLPIRYVIMTRRLMFLQYLLQEEESSLLHRFFKAQSENPDRGDWVDQIKKDLDETKLDIPMEEIRKMSIEVFRNKVSVAVQNAAFKYLNVEKLKMSKIMYVKHEKFEIQQYFQPSGMNIDETQLLFQLRSRMVDVKINFKNKYDDTLCPLCKSADDTQEHVFSCIKLVTNKNIIIDSDIKYIHIFHSDVNKQYSALRMFNSLWIERKKLLKVD